MYKNQLQELAQRSCFNLPSYTSIREGPDHAPRFKSIVNFNGETFQSPHYCSNLRQAEHAAAELALKSLSSRGPSHSLAARILDETGIYKNLLQEISQRVGAPLPHYTAYCSGLDHQPMFTGTVELSGIIFSGEPAKTKKQAEKNAALAAWGSLKQLAQQEASASSEVGNPDELEQVTVARALSKFQLKESMSNNSNTPLVFPQKILIETPRPSSPQHLAVMTSKILPLICPKIPPRIRPQSTTTYGSAPLSQPRRFPAAGASPYVPMQQSRAPCQRIAPAVMIRNVVPVYSAPPLPPLPMVAAPTMPPPAWVAPPVCVRPVVPVHALPHVQKKLPTRNKVADKAEGIKTQARLSDKFFIPAHQLKPETMEKETRELEGVEKMEQLKI